VAGRRPVGWGSLAHGRNSPPPVTSFALLTMCHPPHKVGGKKERACHCEERMRRSNPAFLFALSARGLLRSARNDRTKLILRAPSCVQYNGMAGLHPSPRLRWGGWREAPGGGNSRIQEIAPTRHIVRAAHDVPPQSELRSSRPRKSGRDKKGRAALGSTPQRSRVCVKVSAQALVERADATVQGYFNIFNQTRP
jgi:hypothetical protein